MPRISSSRRSISCCRSTGASTGRPGGARSESRSTSRSSARPPLGIGSRVTRLRESSSFHASAASSFRKKQVTEAFMRRIAIPVTVLALVAGAFGCSSDAPTPPKTGGPGGGTGPTGSTALQIRLFTSNPNPPAGTCTLIQAVVTLNGASVPDGTGVVFTTDFGVFAQNGLPLISVVTQNGSAVTALCSQFPGTAVVGARATVGSETASATITIAFQQAPAGAGPFISFCDPSFGAATGGTALALHG